MIKIKGPIPIIMIAAALASCRAAEVAPVSEARVERGGSGAYQLAWSNPGAPVDVYVADEPYAPRESMRLAVDNDRDGRAVLTVKEAGRPYFYVATDGGAGVWTAERVLPLQGGRNFRDMGGYATEDSRRVKWGKIYRSGSMAGLTEADQAYLSRLGVKLVCDLRTTQERKAEPNKWGETARKKDR
jgi:protein-tyrosine phosphatase